MQPFFKLILWCQSNSQSLQMPIHPCKVRLKRVWPIFYRLLLEGDCWQWKVTFPLLPVSCWQKRHWVNWRREGQRVFWVFVPSVSWPQLWLIKERIAIPAPRHLMSHRPCCIFCWGLVPAQLHQKKEKQYYSLISPVYTQNISHYITQPSRISHFHLEFKLSQITAAGHCVGSGVMASYTFRKQLQPTSFISILQRLHTKKNYTWKFLSCFPAVPGNITTKYFRS